MMSHGRIRVWIVWDLAGTGFAATHAPRNVHARERLKFDCVKIAAVGAAFPAFASAVGSTSTNACGG